MPFTREQAYQALAALQPAPVFLQSYDVKRLPENLEIHFGPPEEFFLAPQTQHAYTAGRLIPILDDGNFGVVTFYDRQSGTLVQIDVESPDEMRATFRGWQQYLTDLMIQIGESVDDDERLRRIAELLQFRYLDELFGFFESVVDLPYDEYKTARWRFVSSISA